MFTPEIYKQRREALMSQMKGGVVLFMSNNEASMNYKSNVYRYRQDSSFIYFYGQQLSGLMGIIDLDRNRDILVGDDYTMDDIIWMGPQPTMQELAGQCGITDTMPMADLPAYLQRAQTEGRTIHYLPTYRDDQNLLISEMLEISVKKVREHASQILVDAVVALRSVKQLEEIAAIEEACNIGVRMHKAVMENCKAGMVERELAGLAEGIALSYGQGVSFPVILSQNGQTLHNPYHHLKLNKGRLLLVDMGAEATSGYSSDYTRTIPVSGKFTDKQKAIYNIVLEANEAAIKMARPGIRYWDVHVKATTIIAEGLTKLGLMKGDPIEATKAGAHALFMPHGLGHMLGLDVHDMEGLGEDNVGYDCQTKRSDIFGHRSLRCGRELKPGFVLTVEPGIYFIPELIQQWEKEGKHTEYIDYKKLKSYFNFGGIRIEDDILITEQGCRVLGKPLPKSVKAIEKLMKRAQEA